MPMDLVAFLCYECIALRQGKVRLDHFTEQCFKRDLRRPAELFVNLARVTKQGFDFGGPEITRIHPYDRVPAVAIDTQLLGAAAMPLDVHAQELTRQNDQVAH